MASPDSKTSGSRRQFLATSAATAATTLAAPRAFGVHTSGDHRLRIGVVGCGGRGKGACRDAIEAGAAVVIVAMADAFEDNLEAAYGSLSEQFASRIDCPKERRFHGFDAYKKVLASDIDMVILATPPGFRPQHFRAAVDAGKHIFMEKPV
ncbi:MAG: Gfo/Idh/MocA family oxidoreductase, partial [Planctomycetota bacterium]